MSDRIRNPAKPALGARLVGVEGLRGIAAVTVLVGHVRSHLAQDVTQPEFIAVPLSLMGQGLTLFFALSGFLLFRPFASALLGERPFPSLRRYFSNRALRVFPVYIVILLFVSLVIGKAYTSSIASGNTVEGAGETVGFMTDPLLLITNVFMLQTFFPSTIKTGLGVAWTLSVELVFYVALPLLCVVAYKLFRRFPKRAAMIAATPITTTFIIGIASQMLFSATANPRSEEEAFYLNWGANWTAVFARSFLTHADLFSLGMLAALLFVLVESGRIKLEYAAVLRWAGLLCGGCLALLARGTDHTDTAFAFLSGALILFVTLPSKQSNFRFAAYVLELRPIRYVGTVSYSMYLWHVPVIWVLHDMDLTFEASLLGFWANVILVLAVSLMVSSLTYEFIEKFALRLKNLPTSGQVSIRSMRTTKTLDSNPRR